MFELLTWTLENDAGFIADQTSADVVGSIGDKVTLDIDYEIHNSPLVGQFWFNPGLFVSVTDTLVNQNELPEQGFYLLFEDNGAEAAKTMTLKGTDISQENFPADG